LAYLEQEQVLEVLVQQSLAGAVSGSATKELFEAVGGTSGLSMKQLKDVEHL
jgi:hypothetical protein